MDYEIYDPTVTESTVIDPYDDPAGLTYVSNSSLEFYAGTYWAVMDGTTVGTVEGSAGQKVYLTTSTDAVTWSTAVLPFSDAAYCNNPITSLALQWQPNLVVVGTELWCTWSGDNTYLSKLTSSSGKWTNYRFEFSGTDVFLSSTVTGAATGGRSLTATTGGHSDWAAFPSSNPIILSSGVVACPVTFQSATLSSETTAALTFTRQLKFNALLKTSDGLTWSMTMIDTDDFGDFCAWEPFVVEDPAGHVRVFSRNLDARVTDQDFLLVAVSADGGDTFAPSVSANMLVPSTRGFARQVSHRRWVMTHVDHPQHSNQTPDQSLTTVSRLNGALFMSRRGLDDFVPGVNFSGSAGNVNYPQFIVGPSGDLLINYTRGGISGGTRRSLRLVTVSPLPEDGTAYIHPRSISVYDSPAPTGPALHDEATPKYYDFNGSQQARSVTALTATTGVTYTAWLQWDDAGAVLIDSRQTSTTAFGQVFQLAGLAVQSLNFNHGLTIVPGSPVFMAAVIDNTAQTVTSYVGTGGTSFTTVTGYYHSILFSGQPSAADTVTINGVAYTFRATATLTNDVQIGASTAATITNLATKMAANAMSTVEPGASRLIMARSNRATFSVSSGSASIAVESGIPISGGTSSFGRKANEGSALSAFTGRMFEGRVYASALTAANLTYLNNSLADDFGYSNVAGTSTAPGAPLLFLNPAAPNTTEFPLLAAPAAAHCEVVSAGVLRIHGEASASVELPYGATELVIRYKLGATPTATDKYVIATFGTVEAPVYLYIAAANPTSLYANGRLVASVPTPTVYNDVTVIVSTNKISIGSFEQYFDGKPRCFLGNAFPQGLLASSKTVDHEVSSMTADLAHSGG